MTESIFARFAPGPLAASINAARAASNAAAAEPRDIPSAGERERLTDAPTMFQAAQRVGRAVRMVHDSASKFMENADISFDVSFLLGGQVEGRRLRLFMIYAAGNFIECTTDSPYLQIGEHKYGKPILDRAVNYETDIYDALKIGLISMDSTMRSNLAVGLPIDMAVIRRDELNIELNYRIMPGEPYFTDLRERWSAALRAAHIAIPRPPYATRPVESLPNDGIDTVLPRTGAHANAANAQLTAGQPAAKVLQQQNPKR